MTQLIKFKSACKSIHRYADAIHVNKYIKDAKHLAEELSARTESVKILPIACTKSGNLNFVRWVAEYLAITPGKYQKSVGAAFAGACKNGHLTTAQWLADYFKITPADACTNNYIALKNACGSGNLELVQWLIEKFGFALNRKSILEYYSPTHAFQDACSEGHLEIAQWLNAHFELAEDEYFREEFYSGNNLALRFACSDGHLDVVQWLVTNFDITLECARENDVLAQACLSGNSETIQWVIDHFGTLLYDSSQCSDNNPFIFKCKYGSPDEVELLVNELGLTSETAYASFALKGACENNNLEVAQWIATRFALTQEDAGEYAYLLKFADDDSLGPKSAAKLS